MNDLCRLKTDFSKLSKKKIIKKETYFLSETSLKFNIIAVQYIFLTQIWFGECGY